MSARASRSFYRFLNLAFLKVALLGGPLAAQPSPEVENVRAFAKLFGYIRYFHPSDEAAALNWNAMAGYGAQAVKSAATPAELKAILEQMFLPVAPTLRLYIEGERVPEVPPELSPPDAADLEPVAWQHSGLGFGNQSSAYRSVRLNRTTTLTGSVENAQLTQCIDATGLGGKTFRYSGWGRAMEEESRFILWFNEELGGGGRGFHDNMMDRPETAPEWTEVALEGVLQEDASRICLGAMAFEGEVWLDDLALEVSDGQSWSEVPLGNPSFEDDEMPVPAGWASGSPGWTLALEEGAAPDGERFLSFSLPRYEFTGPLFDHAPEVGELAEKPLGSGLAARIPLALHSRDDHTIPAGDPQAVERIAEALEAVGIHRLTSDDEAVRLADVVIVWNVFQHFYPYWDVVDSDWNEVLTVALDRALSDQTVNEFRLTLEWMIAQLQDGHGSLFGPGPWVARLPIRVDWVEGQVVVVATDDPAFAQVGDVIETIDGIPAPQRLEELAQTFSGSPQWRRWRALPSFVAGPAEAEVVLEIRRAGDPEGVPERVRRIRDRRQIPTEPRREVIEELEPGIFYVDLDQVAFDDFRARVEELAEARGVVFDLRGYPNGNHMVLTYLTDENLNSAYWQIPQIIYPDHDGEPHFYESQWDLRPSEPRFKGKAVFLTSGRAISYAESVMGIVEHYGLGEIIGQPTAGANGNVNPFRVPGRFRINWTGMRVVKHDLSQHHLVGIQPTIPMAPTLQGIREGRDELLERAIQVIKGG